MAKTYYYEKYQSKDNERTLNIYEARPDKNFGNWYIYKGKLRYKTDEGPFSSEKDALRTWAKSRGEDDAVFKDRNTDRYTFT